MVTASNPRTCMRHPLSVVSLALMLSACGSGPEVSFSEINPEIAVAPPDLLTFLPVVVAETGFADLYVTNAGDAPLDLEWALDDPDGVFGCAETSIQALPGCLQW